MIPRSLFACCTLLGLTALVLSAPVPKYHPPTAAEVKVALAKLQGTYTATSQTVGMPGKGKGAKTKTGKSKGKGPGVGGRSALVRIEGDKWMQVRRLLEDDTEPTVYTMHLDPRRKPMWLDLKGEDMTSRTGILAVSEEGTITFSYVSGSSTTRTRPKDFAPEQLVSTTVMTLRRVDP